MTLISHFCINAPQWELHNYVNCRRNRIKYFYLQQYLNSAQSCFSRFSFLISIHGFSTNSRKVSTNILANPWHRRVNHNWYSSLETSVALIFFAKKAWHKPIYRSFLYRNIEEHSAPIITFTRSLQKFV